MKAPHPHGSWILAFEGEIGSAIGNAVVLVEWSFSPALCSDTDITGICSSAGFGEAHVAHDGVGWVEFALLTGTPGNHGC